MTFLNCQREVTILTLIANLKNAISKCFPGHQQGQLLHLPETFNALVVFPLHICLTDLLSAVENRCSLPSRPKQSR